MPAERLVAGSVCMNSVRAAGLGQRVLGAIRWPDCRACLRQSTGKNPLKYTKSRRRSRGDGMNFATATAVANNQRSARAQPSRTRWQDERTCPSDSANRVPGLGQKSSQVASDRASAKEAKREWYATPQD
jgi:hypothetical protein